MKQAITKNWLVYSSIPLLLSILAGLVYYPSLHYEFQFDDIANITKHFSIRHDSFAKLFFSGPRWISYWLNAINYSLGKFDPFFYRLFNVLIHLVNGILIFCFIACAFSWLRDNNFFKKYAITIATITTALFLLHPVHTQTVSYVVQGQLEGLACMLLVALCLVFIIRNHTQSSIKRLLLTGLLFALAILSCGTKEIAIISPALLLLVDWFFVAQGDWHSLKKRWLLHLIFSTLIATIFLYLLKPHFFTDILGFKRIAKNNIGNVITADPKGTITPWFFFISQFKVILHYLSIFIWPFNISVEYDWHLCQHLFAPDCLIPLIILCAIAYGTLQILRRRSLAPLAFGIMWFFICIAPRSSIIPSPELLVDYKTYTASIGWLFFIASCLTYGAMCLAPLLEKRIYLLRHRHVKPVFIATCALLLGFSTINRNTVWRSGLEFWGNILQNAPNKARAYNNYAVELSQKLHKFEESIPYFKKAIAMDKNYSDPCNNLAVAYSQLGKIELAVEAMKMGLRINPYYPEGYNNLASFYVQQKKLEQAEKMLQNALKLRPHYGKAYFNLGRIHLEKGEIEQAWECFKKCCTIADLDNELGFSMYAKASVLLKKFDDAIFAYQKLLEYMPDDEDAQFNLANVYSLTNQHVQALPLYEKLYRSTPHDHRIIYNMAEAHLRAGNPEKALELFSSLKPLEKQLPHLNIRMAACYEKMGEISTAIALLKQLDNNTIPYEIRSSARELIKKLHIQYIV